MKCWICGDEAKTGEHLVKASDLRNHFGRVDQRMPLFLHTSHRRNVRLGSTNADRLKSKALICNRCNSALTQPYDRAWEHFSEYVQRELSHSPALGYIDFGRVFPVHTRRMAINLQLFFVKLFGCRIVEDSVPIEIEPFAHALIHGKPLPSVHLGLAIIPTETDKKVAGVSPLEGLEMDGKTVYAIWLYSVGTLSVFVTFSLLPKLSKSVRWWRPSRRIRSFPITRTGRW